MGQDLYGIPVVTIDGKETNLEEFRQHALLIVNVASECGFTSQYEGLEELHREFKERHFSVLGFPCDQFGGQEPGSNEQIKKFCESRFQVSFPLFSKVEVNGSGAHPLFQLLKERAKGVLGTEAIKWNFTKFLVSPGGTEIERFAPTTAPESIRPRIQELLGMDAAGE